MKGTVVATWIQTAKKLWGEDVVAAVMEQNGWPANRIFLAQCKTLWDFGFRTYDARLKSMIFRNRYSSSAIP